MFARALVLELTGEEKTAIILGDNMGSLFLAKNKQVSQWTKHINIQQHYPRKIADQNGVTIKFCQSEDNQAGVMTTNVSAQLFGNHYPSTSRIITDYWRDNVEKWKKDSKDIGQNIPCFRQSQI